MRRTAYSISMSLIVCAVVLSTGRVAGAEPAAAAVRAQAAPLVPGVIVDTTNPLSMRLAREAGFTHAKMVLYWPRLEPSPGQYLWLETPENDLDNVLKAAGAENMLLVLRVDEVPGWAGGTPNDADPGAIEAFYAAMASYGRGRIVAYEILNEPNLPFEWGGPPSPAGYTRFLQAAYRGIKAGDSSALVIGGGPSPNTGGYGGTIEDFDFLDGMYRAGAKGSFDALGVHNYGGNAEPERDPDDCGICFRRAELYRRVMLRWGDAATPVWATEFGWLLDAGRPLGQYEWMKVSAEDQAAYVVRSYQYASDNWPWMAGMLLSNLDASTSPYHQGPEDGLPWFAILNEDHSPRPAYDAFKQTFAEPRARPSTAPAEGPARPSERPPSERPPSDGPPVDEPPGDEPPEDEPPAEGSARQMAATGSVRVVNTSGQGVSVREAPSVTARRLVVVPEGATLQVVGADRQGDGRNWRNVRVTSGPTGWVAAEFLRAAG